MPHTAQHSDIAYGYIRFFHIYPTSRILSIFIDDKILHKNWGYEDFSPYFKLTPGPHHILFKDSSNETTFFEKRINVKPMSAFTYLLSEHPKKENTTHLFTLEDTKKAIHSLHGFLRFGHFSKSSSPIKLISGTEHLFFKNIPYTQLTHYMPLTPSTYPFQLLKNEDDSLLIALKAKPIKIGRLYTFYLIGNGAKDYPFKIVRSIDGPSFLALKKSSSEPF